MSQPTNYRLHLTTCLATLADDAAQKRYEQDVPFVPVPVEMIETFYDFYFPQDRDFIAQFCEEEMRRFAQLDLLLGAARERFEEARIHSVADLLKMPEWRKIMMESTALHEALKKEPNQTSEPTAPSGRGSP